MKSGIQGLLVDAMIPPDGNVIIDLGDNICVNGSRQSGSNQSTVAGTVRVSTTPYAF
jgi:hypothetical protein